MLFGGIQKLTLVDYPGKVAATLFTIGCNLRCPFCHNPEIVLPDLILKHPVISEKEILDFLESRKDFLSGVCVTGGEPTLQTDLLDFLRKLKKMKFLVKLDTNGTNPDVLKKVLKDKLADYIAMDIKEPLDKKFIYSDISVIKKSIDLIKKSGLPYEFRTTVYPSLTIADLWQIAEEIKPAQRYYLQEFSPIKNLDVSFSQLRGLSKTELAELCLQMKPFFEICQAR